MAVFRWRHFAGEIILWAVRWYCRYGISYRRHEEMLKELERSGESQVSLTDADSRAMASYPKVGVGTMLGLIRKTLLCGTAGPRYCRKN